MIWEEDTFYNFLILYKYLLNASYVPDNVLRQDIVVNLYPTYHWKARVQS
jgi:hypothetical protein